MKETQTESSKTRETPSLSFRIKKLFWSASQRRLAEIIGPHRRELEHLVEQRENEKKGSTAVWANTTYDMLDKAQEALDDGDVQLGWQYLNSAERMAISGLDKEGLRMRAKAILIEAQKKLTSWRKETVIDLLAENDKPTVSEVQFASGILQEHFTNTYRKLRTLKWQLGILALVSFLAAVPSLFLLPSLFDEGSQLTNPNLVLSVTLFGVMGASISGMLSITRSSTKPRIPEQLLTSWITLTRPLIGAVAALALFAFLISGLLQLGEITPGLLLAVSFAAGFSERLVISAVETVT